MKHALRTDGVIVPLRLSLQAEPALRAQLLRGEFAARVHQALGALGPGGVLLACHRSRWQHQLSAPRANLEA